MEWIHVNEKLPPLHCPVWIYWRDREVLIGYRVYEGENPSDAWYSVEDGKMRWANYWMPISEEYLHQLSKNKNKPKFIINK